MRKTLRFISVFFYYRFKIIKKCETALKRDLQFGCNVYGDGINLWNCRSFWKDKFGFLYRCAELYEQECENKY